MSILIFTWGTGEAVIGLVAKPYCLLRRGRASGVQYEGSFRLEPNVPSLALGIRVPTRGTHSVATSRVTANGILTAQARLLSSARLSKSQARAAYHHQGHKCRCRQNTKSTRLISGTSPFVHPSYGGVLITYPTTLSGGFRAVNSDRWHFRKAESLYPWDCRERFF